MWLLSIFLLTSAKSYEKQSLDLYKRFEDVSSNIQNQLQQIRFDLLESLGKESTHTKNLRLVAQLERIQHSIANIRTEKPVPSDFDEKSPRRNLQSIPIPAKIELEEIDIGDTILRRVNLFSGNINLFRADIERIGLKNVSIDQCSIPQIIASHIELDSINIHDIALLSGAINMDSVYIEDASLNSVNIPTVDISDKVGIGTASIKTVEISESMIMFGMNLTKGSIMVMAFIGAAIFMCICPCQIFAGCLITYRFCTRSKSDPVKAYRRQTELTEILLENAGPAGVNGKQSKAQRSELSAAGSMYGR